MTDVSTKEHVGEFDALETAKPGEPIFTLQGGDPLAPPTIQFWATCARKKALAIMDGERAGFTPSSERDAYEPTPEDIADAERLLIKATNAEQVSWTFKAYQRGDIKPTGNRASYSDVVVQETEEGDLRKKLIDYTGRIHNSIAVACSVVEGLSKRRTLPMTEAKIREAVELLKAAAMELEPRRGNERS